MGNPPPCTPFRPMSTEAAADTVVADAAGAVKRSATHSYNRRQQQHQHQHQQRQPHPQRQDYQPLGRFLELSVMESRGRKVQPSPSSSSSSSSTPSWAALGAFLPSRRDHAGGPRKQRFYCGGRMTGCSVSLCSLRESSKVMHRPDHAVPPHTTPSPDPLAKSKNAATAAGPGAYSPPPPSVRKHRPSDSGGAAAEARKSSPRHHDISRHVPSSLSSSSTVAAAPAASPASSYGAASFGGSRSFRSSRRFAGGCHECGQHTAGAQQGDRPHGCGFSREGSLRASTVCACPDCGEAFGRAESLEHHRAVRHAVSDLASDDSSRSVVEIIVRSSWRLRPPRPPRTQPPRLRIDRVLKINTPPATLAAFEAYRSHVRLRAAFTPAASAASSPTRAGSGRQRYPRCTADGNELLRFRAAHLACGLGRAGGAAALCHEGACAACTVIRVGLRQPDGIGSGSRRGILTLASSGKAHEAGEWPEGVGEGERAMLVCRVIAGRVSRQTLKDGGSHAPMMPPPATSTEWEYDSVAVAAPGVRAGERMDELYVFNPKAILPCFIVVYRCL